ncbi:hypothetical protein D3C80_1278230 [compost metagenome]
MKSGARPSGQCERSSTRRLTRLSSLAWAVASQTSGLCSRSSHASACGMPTRGIWLTPQRVNRRRSSAGKRSYSSAGKVVTPGLPERSSSPIWVKSLGSARVIRSWSFRSRAERSRVCRALPFISVCPALRRQAFSMRWKARRRFGTGTAQSTRSRRSSCSRSSSRSSSTVGDRPRLRQPWIAV